MNNMRRKICQSFGALLGLGSLSACGQPTPAKPQRVYTDEEKQRMHKFRGIGGYDLSVDIFKGYPRGTVCLVLDEKMGIWLEE